MKSFQGSIYPKIQEKLDEMKECSFLFQAHFSRDSQIQVFGGGSQFVVDLENNSYNCQRWQLNDIPCMHACAVISQNNEQPKSCVNDCYLRKTYVRVYRHIINLIDGSDMWPKADSRN